MAKESAEDKLLKMMQKSGAPVSAKNASSVAAAKKPSPKFQFNFTLGHLNQLLFLGIVLCLFGLIFELNNGMKLVKDSVSIESDVAYNDAVARMVLPSNIDVKVYTDKINSRNIFRPYEVPVAKSSVKMNLAKKLSKFKLVGVAWLDLPETASAMIEDTANKTTFFLRQGEQLEGVTVKTIYTDRVVFGDENEETTIKL